MLYGVLLLLFGIEFQWVIDINYQCIILGTEESMNASMRVDKFLPNVGGCQPAPTPKSSPGVTLVTCFFFI